MRSSSRPLLLSLLLLGLLAHQAQARTWRVFADGTGDAPTIQAGIDSAAAGDTVLVADGVYTGTSNKNLDFLGKNLVVRSEDGPEATIIDCEGSGRGFHFHNGETAASVVQGLTIRHGSAITGGGMMIDHCRPTIRECRLLENTATSGGYGGGGGGMYVEHAGAILIDHCVVSGNTAGAGGGLALYGPGGWVEIQSCLITGNLCPDYGEYGGGICTGIAEHDPWVQIRQSTIAGNRASRGGGIGQLSAVDGVVHLEGSIVWGNCADLGNEMYIGSVGADGCCLDTSGVYSMQNLYPQYALITTSPLFCDPEDCLNAPTTGGDYTLDAASPCLPQNNQWGWPMGALGQACDVVTLVASGTLDDSGKRVFSVSPNPSAGSFTVHYGLPSTTTASLAVFDIAGRLVRELGASGASGITVWDGKDGAGRDAAPGVYFVRMMARDYRDTRRITLVR